MNTQTIDPAERAGLQANHAEFLSNTNRIALLLVVTIAALTAGALYLDLAFAGFTALVVLFAGGVWFANRRLRLAAARFNHKPL
jgi:hypothetical protein